MMARYWTPYWYRLSSKLMSLVTQVEIMKTLPNSNEKRNNFVRSGQQRFMTLGQHIGELVKSIFYLVYLAIRCILLSLSVLKSPRLKPKQQFQQIGVNLNLFTIFFFFILFFGISLRNQVRYPSNFSLKCTKKSNFEYLQQIFFSGHNLFSIGILQAFSIEILFEIHKRIPSKFVKEVPQIYRRVRHLQHQKLYVFNIASYYSLLIAPK